MNENRTFRDVILPWATGITMLAAVLMIFVFVPSDRAQGVVQRIFYFHVNLAWMCFAGFFACAISGGLYLWNGSRRADRLALANAEVGMLYTTLMLITGPLWAKPIWGVWWTWDPRLTMTMVLWTVYAAYLMLRRVGDQDEAIRRYSAVLGIAGSLNIPILFLAIRLWRGIHPAVMISEDPDAGIKDPMMTYTFLVTMVGLGLLFTWLVSLRARYVAIDERIAAIHAEAA